jgi:hypothetical protein
VRSANGCDLIPELRSLPYQALTALAKFWLATLSAGVAVGSAARLSEKATAAVVSGLASAFGIATPELGLVLVFVAAGADELLESLQLARVSSSAAGKRGYFMGKRAKVF